MGSYYQPSNYLKSTCNGGSRKSRKSRNTRRSRKSNKYSGGFYPSVMGGVMSAGKFLIAASLRQGYQMLTSKKSKKSKKSKMTRKKSTRKLR